MREGGCFVENAQLVGLSRQVALRRELDVVANNIANIGTAGFKAEQVEFREYMMPVASAENFPARHRPPPVLCRGQVDLAELLLGFDRDHQQPVRRRDRRRCLLRRPDAERCPLHPQRPVPDRQPGTPRHQRRPSGDVDLRSPAVRTRTRPMSRSVRTARSRPRRACADGCCCPPSTIRRRWSAKVRASFVPTPLPSNVAPGQARTVQFAVEKSNVQPIVETTRLIELSRAYQSLAQMMQRSDDLRRTAIERLADVAA